MDKLMRTMAVAASATVVALGGHSRAVAADSCKATAEATGRFCQAGARSDRWVALAKCFNISDPSASQDCRQQAAQDTKDARDDCDSQDDARDTVCSRLGGAPYEPVINPANFVAGVTNPYFPLTPGTTFVSEGMTAEGLEHVEFAVTHNTKVILGVTCTEVRDIATVNGVVAEDTFDWFAQDTAGNVWYFGESSVALVDGLPESLAGSWTAGVNGDKPGIVMKAAPAIGNFYRQEFSVANAEDLAEVIGLSESVTVPTGSFTNCVKTAETSPLSPAVLEHKYYAAGVGNVLTVDVATGERTELIQVIVTP